MLSKLNMHLKHLHRECTSMTRLELGMSVLTPSNIQVTHLAMKCLRLLEHYIHNKLSPIKKDQVQSSKYYIILVYFSYFMIQFLFFFRIINLETINAIFKIIRLQKKEKGPLGFDLDQHLKQCPHLSFSSIIEACSKKPLPYLAPEQRRVLKQEERPLIIKKLKRNLERQAVIVLQSETEQMCFNNSSNRGASQDKIEGFNISVEPKEFSISRLISRSKQSLKVDLETELKKWMKKKCPKISEDEIETKVLLVMDQLETENAFYSLSQIHYHTLNRWFTPSSNALQIAMHNKINLNTGEISLMMKYAISSCANLEKGPVFYIKAETIRSCTVLDDVRCIFIVENERGEKIVNLRDIFNSIEQDDPIWKEQEKALAALEDLIDLHNGPAS